MLVRVRPASTKETSGDGRYRKAVEVDAEKGELTYEGAKTMTFDHCADEADQVCAAEPGGFALLNSPAARIAGNDLHHGGEANDGLGRQRVQRCAPYCGAQR